MRSAADGPTPATPGPDAGFAAPPYVLGRAVVRRVAAGRFPALELVQDGEVLAAMDRYGWLRIFLRSGQRVHLADGTRWRVAAVGAAKYICPVVVNQRSEKLAMAVPGVGNYAINGQDYAYELNPDDARRRGRANAWRLRHREDEIAVFTRRPPEVVCDGPIPLPVVLLGLVLTRFSIPGEADLGVPPFRWS